MMYTFELATYKPFSSFYNLRFLRVGVRWRHDFLSAVPPCSAAHTPSASWVSVGSDLSLKHGELNFSVHTRYPFTARHAYFGIWKCMADVPYFELFCDSKNRCAHLLLLYMHNHFQSISSVALVPIVRELLLTSRHSAEHVIYVAICKSSIFPCWYWLHIPTSSDVNSTKLWFDLIHHGPKSDIILLLDP